MLNWRNINELYLDEVASTGFKVLARCVSGESPSDKVYIEEATIYPNGTALGRIGRVVVLEYVPIAEIQ